MFNSLFKFASSLPGVRVRTIDDKDLSIEDNIIAQAPIFLNEVFISLNNVNDCHPQLDGSHGQWEELCKQFFRPFCSKTKTEKFIEIVTSKSGLAGHSLESFTKNISIIRFTFPEIVDSDICFVDTPGFDDTHGSDEKTLKAISSFIVDTYVTSL